MCVSNINYAFSTVIYTELDTAMPKFFIFHTWNNIFRSQRTFTGFFFDFPPIILRFSLRKTGTRPAQIWIPFPFEKFEKRVNRPFSRSQSLAGNRFPVRKWRVPHGGGAGSEVLGKTQHHHFKYKTGCDRTKVSQTKPVVCLSNHRLGSS